MRSLFIEAAKAWSTAQLRSLSLGGTTHQVRALATDTAQPRNPEAGGERIRSPARNKQTIAEASSHKRPLARIRGGKGGQWQDPTQPAAEPVGTITSSAAETGRSGTSVSYCAI
jgi:hypothetical protein